MNIAPIRTDHDHRAALEQVDRLWGAAAGTEAGDKLDILLTLIENYEERRWPADILDWDPVDVLRFAIDEMGHTQSELSDVLGSRSRASEILNRQRALTVEMIYAISEHWKIPAALLVRPARVAGGVVVGKRRIAVLSRGRVAKTKHKRRR
jgi:HTH-type transcriptional regulator/antitoxin HigA